LLVEPKREDFVSSAAESAQNEKAVAGCENVLVVAKGLFEESLSQVGVHLACQLLRQAPLGKGAGSLASCLYPGIPEQGLKKTCCGGIEAMARQKPGDEL